MMMVIGVYAAYKLEVLAYRENPNINQVLETFGIG